MLARPAPLTVPHSQAPPRRPSWTAGARRPSRQRPTRKKHHVAVADVVVAALDAEAAGRSQSALHRAGVDQLVDRRHLRADEVLLEVRVDDAGGHRGRRSASHGQARASGSPAVKNVIRPPASHNGARTASRLAFVRPYICRISCASSGSSSPQLRLQAGVHDERLPAALGGVRPHALGQLPAVRQQVIADVGDHHRGLGPTPGTPSAGGPPSPRRAPARGARGPRRGAPWPAQARPARRRRACDRRAPRGRRSRCGFSTEARSVSARSSSKPSSSPTGSGSGPKQRTTLTTTSGPRAPPRCDGHGCPGARRPGAPGRATTLLRGARPRPRRSSRSSGTSTMPTPSAPRPAGQGVEQRGLAGPPAGPRWRC